MAGANNRRKKNQYSMYRISLMLACAQCNEMVKPLLQNATCGKKKKTPQGTFNVAL